MSRIKKKIGSWLGLDHYFWNNRPAGLYSVNFHRIGNSDDTSFDPCVFSCTTKELDDHITFFKKNFRIISIAELNNLLSLNQPIEERLMCVTFDDGYIDNFTNALPVLKKHKISASFFIATALIGSNTVPWWDKVAYLLKTYRPTQVKLSNWKKPVLNTNNEKIFIRDVLTQIKCCKTSAQNQIYQLEKQLGFKHSYPEAEFMNWDHLRYLLEEGMEIGAHSHNHDILTKLSEDELFYELSHSKALLESKLKTNITAFSYPVGNRSTYNEKVIIGLKNNGYELAFNFQPGINRLPLASPYDLHRFPIAPGISNEDLMKLFGYAKRF